MPETNLVKYVNRVQCNQYKKLKKKIVSRSVMSDSLQPQGL